MLAKEWEGIYIEVSVNIAHQLGTSGSFHFVCFMLLSRYVYRIRRPVSI